ncbi:MAG: PTS alpha-glucoside transporter subunit IIBC [Ruminococcaceae bacterium]|nr:PTS alpha-glucoside transporter subunit IIBC [Oscillospiraceae bacterium]
MMQKIQRFGGAMFTPVLLFAFAGITVGLSSLFMNGEIMGTLADPDGMWYKVWNVIQEGGWTVFRQIPLIFVVGLPIGLAKKQNARACLEALVVYLTFNYFLSAILSTWGDVFGVDFSLDVGGGTGLTEVAGIKTLDMGIVGAIVVSSIVVYLHNKYFDTPLPEFLGIFKGSTFVFILGFFAMIPTAIISAIVWPKVQLAIVSLQEFLASSGVVGVGIYSFLNRILIPTGLHHFINTPFIYDNAIVDGGIASYWMLHLNEFAASTEPLIELFPQGGFALYGMTKIFGSIGIALAFYKTASPEKKKTVAGLLIPTTLTSIVAGVTEPLEFTFLFVAPPLFVIHSIFSALLDVALYLVGVTGYFTGGAIEFAAMNWIPLWRNHSSTYLAQFAVGIIFTVIYFFVFTFLIRRFNYKTPGREDDGEETRLYSKADYKEKQAAVGERGGQFSTMAADFLDALGGAGNIAEVTNCATRLRVSVKDESLVQDAAVFKSAGAHGAVIKGTSVQVIVGLNVPSVREEFEKLL